MSSLFLFVTYIYPSHLIKINVKLGLLIVSVDPQRLKKEII
jgi:hypothetical protein